MNQERLWQRYWFWASLMWLAFALCYFITPLPTYQHWHDIWEHVAAVRELSVSPWSPSHPQLAVASPSRQFTPVNLLMAGLVRLFSTQPLTVVLFAGPIYLAIVLLGLKRFFDAYFSDKRAALFGLLVLYGLWGTPWVSTGLHNLRAVFYSGAYPSTLIFGLGLFMWVRVLRFSKKNFDFGDFLFLFFATSFSFICHQLSTVIALLMMFLLQIFNSGIKTRSFVYSVLAVTTGLLFSRYWLYFDPVELTLAGGRDPINKGNKLFESFFPVLLLIGPALLGFLGFRQCVSHRRYWALPAGFIVFFGCYLLGAASGNPVTHRLLPPAVLCLHLAFVLWLISLPRVNASGWKPGLLAGTAYGVCAATMLAELMVVALDISKVASNRFSHAERWQYKIHPVVSDMTQVSYSLSQNSVVAADATLSVSLPAFAGKLLASYRGINLIPDLLERRAMNSRLLGDTAAMSERNAIVKRYGVTHLLLLNDEVAPVTVEQLTSMGHVLSSPTGITLIRIR